MTSAVIYAAKSTEDTKGSIPTQIADCRTAAEAVGREVVGVHQDEARSAFSGNRGPGLEAAKAQAVEAAREGGAELWVQHSDRLARGDGLTADHLAEVYFAMRRQGVRLRSVQDDHNLDDALRAVLIGERNNEDSSRKAQAVASGLRRNLDAGLRGGGPVPDGYLVAHREYDQSGRLIGRTYALDPAREPVLSRIFDLADDGMGDTSIARQLNAEGHRTKRGAAWTRRRVQDSVTNPFYAGRVAQRGTGSKKEYALLEEPIVVDGTHPALVAPERFDRIQKLRRVRDRAAGSERNPRGRPARTYALARLAVCGRCGARMYASTSPYRRTDGTHRRRYQCGNVRFATGLCDAPPVSAEVVDPEVINNLENLLLDYEGWRASVESDRRTERERLAEEVSRADADRSSAAAAVLRVEDRWQGEEDIKRAEALLDMLVRAREAAERADARLTAARDALAEVVAEPSHDAMLDFWNGLRATVAGRIDGQESMLAVNDALRDLFAAFVLDTTSAGVLVQPVLAAATVAAVTALGDEPSRDDVVTLLDALDLRVVEQDADHVVLKVMPPETLVATGPTDVKDPPPLRPFLARTESANSQECAVYGVGLPAFVVAA